MPSSRSRTACGAAALALALASVIPACQPVPAPRNVKLATYNGAYLVFPVSSDGAFFDANGNPLTNAQRATLLAQHVLASDVEVIAFNEVFDDDAREALVKALEPTFRYYVAYIGNDSDPSDSGLMLFSRHPFEEMQLEPHHVYDCGDVEIGYAGTTSECSDKRLGFAEFECGPEYNLNADCLASKGVGLVKVRLPLGESLYVGFSHFLASYPEDSENPLFPGDIVPCAKKRDRQAALRQFQELVEDAVAEDTGAAFDANVALLGDLNVNGNAFKSLASACLDSEWADAFSATAELRFPSCADKDRLTCLAEDRVLVDAWRFTTSSDDLGRSNGFDFTLDLADDSRRGEGERLDYALLRGPIVPDPAIPLMVPQHMTIEYRLSGALGELSDHLPLGANVLLPGRDVLPEHAIPVAARPLVLPPGGTNAAEAMEITVRGQMQWLRFEGPKGTYTFRALPAGGPSIALDIYARSDLSRPIAPRREAGDRGFVYVLNDPPYFLRAFAELPGGARAHDRLATGAYTVTAHRHDCTSLHEACILTAGETGEDAVEVTWPAANPVNAEDTLWFEFYADDPSGPQPPTVHDFAVLAGAPQLQLPPFDFAVVDFETASALPGVTWADNVWTPSRRERRALGVVGNVGQTPSWDNHLLKVRRSDVAWGGTVRMFHGTNLSYVVPRTLSIEQEEDDSAHDELRLYMKADNSDTFYQTANQATIHQHAAKFQGLPQIDEIEDGGSPWPCGGFLGTFRVTAELPLVLIEDDNEDSEHEPGDFLLARPAPSNPGASANGFALGLLAVDSKGGPRTWRWTDDPGESDPDDTSYWYTLRFEVTHCPPDFDCDA